MDASSFLFGTGLIASAGVVLYAVSRGDSRPAASPDHYRVAIGHLGANDLDAALESLRRTVQSPHAPPDAYIKLGNLLRARGDAPAALQVHRSLTVRRDLNPHEREATLRALADDHRALGQHAETLAALQQLAAMRRDADVLTELARELLLQDQYDEAATTIREAARVATGIGRSEIAAFLAAAAAQCLRQGQAPDAKRLLQQSLKEDDACPRALAQLGDIAMAEGDHESALYYWQKLVFAGTSASAGAHEKLERVYFELGKFSDIERVYAQILESRPRDLETLHAAARIALKKGEAEDAERLLRRALDANPASHTAFYLLAGLWLDEGKTRDLRELLAEHAAQDKPENAFVCPQCGQQADIQPGYCIGCGHFGEYRAAS